VADLRKENIQDKEGVMASQRVTYNEVVEVWSVGGELLGKARFVGAARQSAHSGLWSWAGQLYESSFDPGLLMNHRELKLRFGDGAMGQVLCRRVAFSTGRWLVDLLGNGMPPRCNDE
jgi:hypothetical protein